MVVFVKVKFQKENENEIGCLRPSVGGIGGWEITPKCDNRAPIRAFNRHKRRQSPVPILNRVKIESFCFFDLYKIPTILMVILSEYKSLPFNFVTITILV